MPKPEVEEKPLWRDADFLKIWAARTTSNLGALMSVLPLIAILTLDARPYQMAILGGATTASGLVFGLVAGVWIDRVRRRPVLVAADLARAVSTASLAVAYFLFELRIEHLYVVAFINGSLRIFDDVAYRAYLPGLVGQPRIQDANAKVSASGSIVEQIGFSVGGFIAQLASAITAGIVQAVTFTISGLLVLAIRNREPAAEVSDGQSDVRRELGDGYRLIARDEILRVIAVAKAAFAASSGIIGGMISLFAIDELGIQPGPLGLIYGVGGISSFFAAIFAARFTRKIGLGRSLFVGILVPGVIGFLIPLAPAHIWLGAVFLLLPQIFGDFFWTLHDINSVSLLQSATPERFRGRVASAISLSGTLAAMAGLVIAGVVAELAGLRWALALGFGGWTAAAAVYLHPAVRRLKALPELPTAAEIKGARKTGA
jgi:MFS family permease